MFSTVFFFAFWVMYFMDYFTLRIVQHKQNKLIHLETEQTEWSAAVITGQLKGGLMM